MYGEKKLFSKVCVMGQRLKFLEVMRWSNVKNYSFAPLKRFELFLFFEGFWHDKFLKNLTNIFLRHEKFSHDVSQPVPLPLVPPKIKISTKCLLIVIFGGNEKAKNDSECFQVSSVITQPSIY